MRSTVLGAALVIFGCGSDPLVFGSGGSTSSGGGSGGSTSSGGGSGGSTGCVPPCGPYQTCQAGVCFGCEPGGAGCGANTPPNSYHCPAGYTPSGCQLLGFYPDGSTIYCCPD